MTWEQMRLALTSRRRSKGWTQERLAYEMNLHQSMISEWETGVYVPRATNLIRWCAALGLGLDFTNMKEMS
jgi:transcriptional regulator with XRE-family HTH domain